MWASAKVRHSINESLQQLAPFASSWFFPPARPNALYNFEFWWCEKGCVNFDAFDQHELSELIFKKRTISMSAGIQQLLTMQRQSLRVEWEGQKFSASASLFADGIRLFVKCENESSLKKRIFHEMNFVPNFVPGTFGKYANEWVPIRGVFKGTGPSSVHWDISGLTLPAYFSDETFQEPIALSFLIPFKQVDKAVSVLSSLASEFGEKLNAVTLADRPYKTKPRPELLKGKWDIIHVARLKKDVDPLERPSKLEATVRYPIAQRREHFETGLFKELHWQIDIVHTPTESFFDVQTSRGQEYLLEFLKEHQMEGEIWPDRFEGRL